MRLGLALYFVSSVIEKKKRIIKMGGHFRRFFYISDILALAYIAVFLIRIENSEIKITGLKIGWDPDPVLVRTKVKR